MILHTKNLLSLEASENRENGKDDNKFHAEGRISCNERKTVEIF